MVVFGVVGRVLIFFGDVYSHSLTKDETAVVFGEDVAFGGVFRCTLVSAPHPFEFRILPIAAVGSR